MLNMSDKVSHEILREKLDIVLVIEKGPAGFQSFWKAEGCKGRQKTAKVLLYDFHSELSFHFLPGPDLWLSSQMSAAPFLSSVIQLQMALAKTHVWIVTASLSSLKTGLSNSRQGLRVLAFWGQNLKSAVCLNPAE